MAEQTGLRNNALPYPIYGVPFGVTFPLLDADGDPVSPSSPDSEKSLNGDTFSDCTNEAVEIATSTGICYLLLTGAEMTADVVTVRIQSTGAKTTVLTLYPRKLVSIASGTAQGSNDTGDIQLAAGSPAIDDFFNGCVVVATIDTVVEARLINDYVGSTLVAEVSPAFATAQPDSTDTYVIYMPEGRQITQSNLMAVNSVVAGTTVAQLGVNVVNAGGTAWASGSLTSGVFASGAITATAIATDAIGAAELADGAITAATFAAGAIDATAIATGAIDADALAADTITAAKVHADVSTEINAGILAVLGALNDAAADGAVTTTDTLVAYLKQIINTLEGAPGIPTWPAAAAPGNAVSIAEALRYLYDQVGVAGAGLTAADDAVISAVGGVDAKVDIIDANVDAILVDTGTTLQGELDAIEAAVITNAAGADIAADIIAIKAETAAILDDTDDIGVAGAGLTVLATAAALDAVDNFVDTEITALTTMLTGVVPLNGTIGATGNDSTHLHLAGIAWGDDGPNSMLILVQDVSGSIYVSRWIEDFATAGDLATVATLPFTPEASVDKYWVLSPRADVTGGSGLDAAGVRAAVGLASANLDTQLGTIDTNVDDIETAVITNAAGTDIAADIIAIKSETAAILDDTDDIGVAGAGLTVLATQASVTTIDDILDAEFPALVTAVADLPTNAELATALGTADDATLAQIALVKAKTDLIPADPADASDIAALIDALPTSAENAAALLDFANGVETGLTPKQALRLMAAALLGKASGLETTTAVYRDTGDTKARITATVDADGNRSAVTLDAT